jgi:glucose-1-phosphate thymidylyltransferase
MKGILLAGGLGTRMFPLTKGISKQVLPVYDKPMIYYPLSVLMLAGIREILIISTERDTPIIKQFLGDGSHIGLSISYKVQESPDGIAQSFILGSEFIGNSNVCLILGDNILYGHELTTKLEEASALTQGASIFAYHVHDPERYGVVEFDKNHNALSIEEKPKTPKSNWAVTGLYFYDNNVINIAKSLKPSARGELEITDVNKAYLANQRLKVNVLGRGVAWLDTGTVDSLLSAAHFVQIVQSRQGLKIACIEEIAYRKGFIDLNRFEQLANSYKSNEYGQYMRSIILEERP